MQNYFLILKKKVLKIGLCFSKLPLKWKFTVINFFLLWKSTIIEKSCILLFLLVFLKIQNVCVTCSEWLKLFNVYLLLIYLFITKY